MFAEVAPQGGFVVMYVSRGRCECHAGDVCATEAPPEKGREEEEGPECPREEIEGGQKRNTRRQTKKWCPAGLHGVTR